MNGKKLFVWDFGYSTFYATIAENIHVARSNLAYELAAVRDEDGKPSHIHDIGRIYTTEPWVGQIYIGLEGEESEEEENGSS